MEKKSVPKYVWIGIIIAIIIVVFIIVVIIESINYDNVEGTVNGGKNIYNSQWESLSGYVLIINDPEKNPKLSKPTCDVRVGKSSVGMCKVSFDKSNGTLSVTWAYNATSSIGGGVADNATISKDTTVITLNDTNFIYAGTIE